MTPVHTGAQRVDRLFSTGEARLDRWYNLALAAQTWAAKPDKSGRAAVETAFAELRQAENFFGYPGPRLLRAIEDEIAQGDGGDVARLVGRINTALLSNSYRADASDWETSDDTTEGAGALRLPRAWTPVRHAGPTSSCSSSRPRRRLGWPALAQELRRLRRPEDDFIYEAVVVGSFEDAVLGRASSTATSRRVVIGDGFPFQSRHDVPVLHEPARHPARPRRRRGCAAGVRHAAGRRDQARAPGARRLPADRPRRRQARRRSGEAGADPAHLLRRRGADGDPSGDPRRRQRPLRDARTSTTSRSTPQRPIGTFHALPIARGKSIFKSNWIRDMGEFYGANLFLAESSATTGGLDSLLEPTGNIKVAQDKAARAFGGDAASSSPTARRRRTRSSYQALLPARRHRPRSTATATSRTTTASCWRARSRSTSTPSR